MAHTSRTQRLAVLVASASCLAAGAALLVPAYAGHHDPLKSRQHKVHRGVQHARGDLEESSRALGHARAKLAAARGRLRGAERSLAHTRARLKVARKVDHRMQARLAKARDALAAAQADVARSRAAIATQQEEIGKLALENYQYGDPQLMGLVAMLGSGDPREVTTQLNAVHGVMSRESSTLDDLRIAKVRLVAEEDKVQSAEERVAEQRAVAAKNLAERRRLERAAKAQRHEVARLVASRRHAQARAARVKTHDLRQLRALQRRENRIKRQILARARHQRNRVVRNTGGMLYRPVPGYVTSPYGWRRHPIYGYWGLHDGDDFHAPCGTPERAAGNGRVISEYYSSVWGNRLYLDLGKINGHNFTVIYNHINRYRVGAGAQVLRGDIVAYAGTTGWSTGCHLHFTVMRDGVAVNPMDYM